ncbi:rsbT co-antagonist protein RsbR [Amycolatopsis pretoriensis]|uniref:RsbT co-antagonist protein RsbR n=1 Tax=Amycolatopsis pretoriensis TaxID=218821 RepID=A0A1H5Q290_9PSEU|nr:rsbT co-antagonist protein RsbR [Amycolatopsis pretoriensis]
MLGTDEGRVREVLARTLAEDQATLVRDWAGQQAGTGPESDRELRREATGLLEALGGAVGGTLPVARIAERDPGVRDALTSWSERRARVGAEPSAAAMAMLALKRTMLGATERRTEDSALRYRAALLVDELLASARTQVVMNSLLEAIQADEARVAIIDITGVPTVDTAVAQHLLMGAECVVSGIRPSIAQTITQLGIDERTRPGGVSG